MSYRPICDVWLLARAKMLNRRKYYGSYMGGFPDRARVLLGVRMHEPVLHVCGGMAMHYPYKRGVGPNDQTLDLAPETKPHFLQDARDPLPQYAKSDLVIPERFWAYLIDPPYTPEDAEQYAPGMENYPKPNELIKNAINSLPVGGRVGIIHYVWPMPPKNSKELAVVGVPGGHNNKIRQYTVYEKIEE